MKAIEFSRKKTPCQRDLIFSDMRKSSLKVVRDTDLDFKGSSMSWRSM